MTGLTFSLQRLVVCDQISWNAGESLEAFHSAKISTVGMLKKDNNL